MSLDKLVKIDFDTTGTAEAAAEAKQVDRALAGSAKSAKAADTALKGTARSADKATAAEGRLKASLARSNEKTAESIKGLGSMFLVTDELASVMGKLMGALGLATAAFFAIKGAAGLVSDMLDAESDSAKRAAEATAKMTKALQKQKDAFEEAAKAAKTLGEALLISEDVEATREKADIQFKLKNLRVETGKLEEQRRRIEAQVVAFSKRLGVKGLALTGPERAAMRAAGTRQVDIDRGAITLGAALQRRLQDIKSQTEANQKSYAEYMLRLKEIDAKAKAEEKVWEARRKYYDNLSRQKLADEINRYIKENPHAPVMELKELPPGVAITGGPSLLEALGNAGDALSPAVDSAKELAGAFRDAWTNAGELVKLMDEIAEEKKAQRFSFIVNQVADMSQALGDAALGAIFYGEGFEKGVNQALNAIFRQAAGMAIFEGAAALASLALGNVVSAELHGQAAAMYGLLAAGAGLGAAVTGGFPNTEQSPMAPAITPPGSTSATGVGARSSGEATPLIINITFSGQSLATKREVEEAVIRAVNEGQRRRGSARITNAR